MSNHAHRRGRRPRQPKPSPAGVALLDQAAAAGRQTHAAFHGIADRIDGHVTHDATIGPVTRQIYDRVHLQMIARVLAGQPSLCPHLSHSAPQPAVWLVWAPELVRCPPCAAVEEQRIAGTPDDRRCDHCGAVGPTINPCVLELPAVVVDHLPRGEASSLPPMLMGYGLCPTCFEADRGHRR